MSKPIDAKLFTHPACTCGPTFDLVSRIASEYSKFSFKEISLVTPDGRKQSAEVGVKVIPSLFFMTTNSLLVTSQEITEERIKQEIEKLLKQ